MSVMRGVKAKVKIVTILDSEKSVFPKKSVHILGCGQLYVMDGNWKLCYVHCMFPVDVKIPGYEKEINYPNICPLTPKHQSAFCPRHHNIVENKDIPTNVKQFLLHCRKKKQGI